MKLRVAVKWPTRSGYVLSTSTGSALLVCLFDWYSIKFKHLMSPSHIATPY